MKWRLSNLYNWVYIETRVKSQHDYCFISILYHQATVSIECIGFLWFLVIKQHSFHYGIQEVGSQQKKKLFVSTSQIIDTSFILNKTSTSWPYLKKLPRIQKIHKFHVPVWQSFNSSYTCLHFLYTSPIPPQSSPFVWPNRLKPTSICNKGM